jgi:hypothetical protein
VGSAAPAGLAELINAAVPFEVYAASRAPRGDAPSAKPSVANDDTSASPDLAFGMAAIGYLLEKGELSVGGYEQWMRIGLALKNTYGEEGFAAWLAISEEAEGFESEDACRKQWKAFKPRADGKPLTIGTYVAQAQAAGWKPPRRQQITSNDQEGQEEGSSGKLPKGTDAGAHVVDLAIEAGDELWTDQDGKPHVTYLATLPDTREVARHAPVASEAYAAVLQQRFHDDVPNKVLTKDQLTLAVQLLGHKATEGGLRHVAALRVGEHAGRIYVDLGRADGAAAEVDNEGWRVVPDAPVRFVRGTRGELPDPELGGTLANFERHFNLSRDDLLRLLGFLVGTFNVSGSYSILLTDGEQGSGKSTLNDKTVSLVDPPRQFKGARMAFNGKEQDMQIGALGVHVPYFDNVTSFSGDSADALCRLSTGGGSGARTLYTNTGYTEISVIRPIIVTSIGSPSSRPDLLSRSVRVTALSLAGQRKTERRVVADFMADRPKLFGFLLTCVSAALRNRGMVEAAVDRGEFELPRMADFAEWVEGAHEVLGLPLGGFSKLLDDGQSAMQTESVLGTAVGAGLVAWFSERNSPELHAPARDILAMIRGKVGPDARLPASNGLGKALARLSVGLRALGIEWSVSAAEGHENVQRYRIRTTAAFQAQQGAQRSELDDGGGHF